jgi:hypothetical protein
VEDFETSLSKIVKNYYLLIRGRDLWSLFMRDVTICLHSNNTQQLAGKLELCLA